MVPPRALPRAEPKGEMENWDNLRYLLALYRHRTMSAASTALSTNIATVSRRIDKVSRDLGVALFVKDADGWKPTPAAMPLVTLAEEIDGRLATETHLRASAGAETLHARIRIAAPSFFNTVVLVPQLHRLIARYPQLEIDIANRNDATGLGDADLLLRVDRPESGRVVARRLTTLTFRAYRSRLARQPMPGWVSVSYALPSAPPMVLGRRLFGRDPNVMVALFEQKVRVMRSTGMAAVLPDLVARGLPDITPVDEADGPTIESELWMVYHVTRREDPALRAVSDWIVDCFRDGLMSPQVSEHGFDIAV